MKIVSEATWLKVKARHVLIKRVALCFCLAFALLPMPRYSTGVLSYDEFEYHSMLNAWINHASPDIRTPDIPKGGVWPPVGFYASPVNGGVYCWHFWLYSLSAVPARLWLQWIGGDPLSALQMVNRWFFFAACYILLFCPWAAARQRALLFSLAACNVILFYLRWDGPEIFCWALVVFAGIQLQKRHYVGAATCAAFAAMQNPPLLFLAFFCAFYSLRERRLATTALAAFAASGALLPALFYWLAFGHISLIAAEEYTDFSLISLQRLWGFFTDLNQGIFFYCPLLVLLWLLALGQAVRQRNIAFLTGSATLIVMVLSTTMAINWNSGGIGIHRYAVWTVPFIAWLVASGASVGRYTSRAIVLAVLLQFILLLDADFSSSHRLLAQWVLKHTPVLYNPDPEVFVDRTLQKDTISREYLQFLPAAFLQADGSTTKILTDASHLDTIVQQFSGNPTYQREILSRYAERQGLFYLHPPPGALYVRNSKSN
jgi:hypothetical protein